MTSGRVWKGLFLCALVAMFGRSIYAQNFSFPLVSDASADSARPFVWIAGSVDPSALVHGPGQTNCSSTTNLCYYTPFDVRTAYAVSSILNGNGGAGSTVAIVVAYSNTQTEADLATFSSAFGLPACTVASGCLTFVNQTGESALPGCSDTPANCAGWWGEEDLDAEWVHAIAPNARIVVVCANSSSLGNLFTGIITASGIADVVTNSWGAPEFSGEASVDPIFAGSTVPILVASGDQKGSVAVPYPSSSPYVVAVGGTNLLETATSYRNVEGGWGDGSGGAGGGCSVYEAQPAYQSGYAGVCGGFRGIPDVALIADPYTGVLVYWGSNATGGGPAGLYVIGGTSLSSPVLAGLVANIDAARVAAGKSRIGNNLNALLYQAVSGPYYHYRMYDVTSLTNNLYAAGLGWDRASGLGVPMGPALAAFLVSLP